MQITKIIASYKKFKQILNELKRKQKNLYITTLRKIEEKRINLLKNKLK